MRFILEKAGHTVSEAHNGHEALALLGVEPPAVDGPLADLIILDVMMPLMDGLTAAKRLQADERARMIPIVVVTAKHDLRTTFEALPNVAGFLSKPFDPQTLRRAVDKVVKK